MEKEGSIKNRDFIIPSLFLFAILLVIIFLGVSLNFQNKYPTIKNGATTTEVEQYAYHLLDLEKDSAPTFGYDESLAYYNSQIAAATDREQKCNLQLDFSIFYGNTGDPASGLQLLDTIEGALLPLDARYYLYSTYIYLFNQQGDEDAVAEYQQKISDEGILDYIAGIDDGQTVNQEESEVEEDVEELDSQVEQEPFSEDTI